MLPCVASTGRNRSAISDSPTAVKLRRFAGGRASGQSDTGHFRTQSARGASGAALREVRRSAQYSCRLSRLLRSRCVKCALRRSGIPYNLHRHEYAAIRYRLSRKCTHRCILSSFIHSAGIGQPACAAGTYDHGHAIVPGRILVKGFRFGWREHPTACERRPCVARLFCRPRHYREQFIDQRLAHR